MQDNPAAPPPAAPAAPPPAAPVPPDNASIVGTLPTHAATLTSLEALRVPLKQSLDAIDAEIDRVSLLAHAAMIGSGMASFRTSDAVFELKPKVVYVPTDWDALQQHIITTGEFDLIKRALSSTALRERGEALPPGVARNTFNQFSFSLTKKGKK